MLSPEDRQGVETTLDRLASAWNQHDMKTYGSFLTEDCDWVNIVGMHWVGRPQVVKAHTAFHETMFKHVCVHELDREIGEVAPGVVIVVLTFSIDDFTTPDGRRMSGMKDRMTYILVKRRDEWLIRSAHNTTIDPIAIEHDPCK